MEERRKNMTDSFQFPSLRPVLFNSHTHTKIQFSLYVLVVCPDIDSGVERREKGRKEEA